MGTFEEEFGGRMYRQDDWDNYPCCYNCRRYSVFMFYLDDIAKAQAIYPDVHQGELILCSECVPVQAEYERIFPGERAYREDSILNNREIFELLEEYSYNVPTFKKYADLDRLILTSNVMLKEGYKHLLKQPVPKTKKIKVLMSMFPRIHRFRNRKYASGREVIEAVKAKSNEIRSYYRNLPEDEASRYHDQYDVMLNATPRHQRPSQDLRPPQPEPVDPVVEEEQHRALDVTNGSADATMSSANNSHDVMRLVGSDASDDSIQISSESLASHGMTISSSQGTRISSQRISDVGINVSPSQGTRPTTSQAQRRSQRAASQELDSSGEREPEGNKSSSQSIAQISSQSIAGENLDNFSSQGTQPTASQPQPGTSQSQPMAISSEEVQVASPMDTSSDSSSASSDHTGRKRRSADSVQSDDDLRPGPSRKKRARPEKPMNPTPEEFVKNPSVGRLPRTDGG